MDKKKREHKISKNLMEIVVMNKLEAVLGDLDCCTCDGCLLDIAAYVLNRMPPKYITTSKGDVFSHLDALSVQHSANIMTLIMEASLVIKENPRHREA